MSRRTRYGLELALLVLGLLLILAAPDVALAAIVVAVPLTLLASGISIVYLSRVLSYQPIPRSRFFRMLVGVSARVEIIGLWVGYLVIGRISQIAEAKGMIGWSIPTPPSSISSPISGLVIAIFAAPPIAYAVTVWRIRRAALRNLGDGSADVVELDRE